VTSGDDELPDLLRQALHAEADRQVPAGDGLQRIRERVNARRRRLAWLRPSLAVVAAAGVVVAVTVVPTVLRDLGQPPPSSQQAGSQPGPAAEPALPSASQPPPTQGRTASPQAKLYDMRTVWPYASRAEGTSRADGDVARGVHPELTNAANAAVTFVQSYVGHQTALSAKSNGRLGSGIGVSVYRALPDGSQHLVSLVYLVRVRDADDSPYVVAAASRSATAGDPTTLAVFPPAEVLPPSPGRITVTGDSRRPGQTTAPIVRVEIRDETATQDLTFNQADLVPDPVDTDLFSWATTLSLFGADVSKANTIAAWTQDDTGAVLEFVATPVPLEASTTGSG
jgi:hypothetical protein